MHLPSAIKSSIPALLLVAVLGCGSSGNGTMNVHLVDGPGDYLKIMLNVQEVQIHGADGAWISLSKPNKTVDLLTLVSGSSEALATEAELPAGHYDQIRLVLGAGNQVTLADGAVHDLKVPSGMQSGIKVNVSFDVEPGVTKDVYIDVDGHRSIFLHSAGNSGQYILRPVVRAIDLRASGTISGTVSTGPALPLGGVVVTAQTFEAGKPVIVRTARTDETGKYRLDLLPFGNYHVVTQASTFTTGTSPQVTTHYVPTASAEIPVASTPVVHDVSLVPDGPAQSWGLVTGDVVLTPVASESDADIVSVLGSLPLDGTPTTQTFIVDTAVTKIVDASETYTTAPLPFGDYGLVVTRRTLQDGTDVVVVSTDAVPVAVDAITVTKDLLFP